MMDGSDDRRGIQKMEPLFCRILTESDVLHVLSVPKAHQDVFFHAQDEKGEVGIIEVQSGEEWRFHLGFSKNDEKCTFNDGWLQYVKAKGLAFGDSVIFHRAVGLKSTDKLHNQLYIECITQSQKPSVTRKATRKAGSSSTVTPNFLNSGPNSLQSLKPLEEMPESSSIVGVGQKNTNLISPVRNILQSLKALEEMPESSSTVSLGQKNINLDPPFNKMLQSLKALEETGHLVVWKKSESQSQLLVGHTRSGFPHHPSLDLLLISSPQVFAQCVDCFLYLSLFPKEYEIDRDTLVQLWMVAGLLKEVSANIISAGYFEALQSSGCISCSREDNRTGQVLYKVNKFTISFELSTRFSHLRVDQMDDTIKEWSKIEPLEPPRHVTVQRVPPNLRVLKRLVGMRTLWFLHGHESCIEHVPYDLFISLRVLEILCLNGMKVSELPSSIAILKDLRYLDLSQTLIKHLPETIGCLQKLQILKLQNCPHLVTLPKNTTKLTSLMHLDLGTLCYLNSMCPGIGALTCLRTLSQFPVGSEGECSLAELKNLRHLQGSFCLSRLQNVNNLAEVKEANLRAKPGLSRLELRWCPRAEKDFKIDDQVIEYLEPHARLTNLRILYYGGSKFPSWIANPSFKNLVSITLFKCEECQYLPALGQLGSLESITLNGLLGVRIIGLNFCGNSASTVEGSANGAFPKLQYLALTSMLSLESWIDMGELCFPSLLKLTIKDCPKLVALCSLANILSLQVLEMSYCPLLPSLPSGRLPASVEKLVIEDCPLLRSSCSKLHGQDWHKMEHIPSVWIDYEEISSQ